MHVSSILFVFFLMLQLLRHGRTAGTLTHELTEPNVVGARSLWQRPDARQIIRE
jgi:hypothetical protein